jgi:hypothetical protein
MRTSLCPDLADWFVHNLPKTEVMFDRILITSTNSWSIALLLLECQNMKPKFRPMSLSKPTREGSTGQSDHQTKLICLSHGIGRLKPIYFDRISKGILKPFAPVEIIRESPTTALVDGNLGLGLYIGPYWSNCPLLLHPHSRHH